MAKVDVKSFDEVNKELTKKQIIDDEFFVPTTCERHITKEIVFRPVRSWHQCTFAGEGLEKHKGDGSGCIRKDADLIKIDLYNAMAPKTATHRVYWHKANPEFHVSAFLSYPNGMSSEPVYHWEIHPVEYVDSDGEKFDDIERFFGDDGELKMEEKVKEILHAHLNRMITEKIIGSKKQ